MPAFQSRSLLSSLHLVEAKDKRGPGKGTALSQELVDGELSCLLRDH
jgi:hypothetical protein